MEGGRERLPGAGGRQGLEGRRMFFADGDAGDFVFRPFLLPQTAGATQRVVDRAAGGAPEGEGGAEEGGGLGGVQRGGGDPVIGFSGFAFAVAQPGRDEDRGDRQQEAEAGRFAEGGFEVDDRGRGEGDHAVQGRFVDGDRGDAEHRRLRAAVFVAGGIGEELGERAGREGIGVADHADRQLGVDVLGEGRREHFDVASGDHGRRPLVQGEAGGQLKVMGSCLVSGSAAFFFQAELVFGEAVGSRFGADGYRPRDRGGRSSGTLDAQFVYFPRVGARLHFDLDPDFDVAERREGAGEGAVGRDGRAAEHAADRAGVPFESRHRFHRRELFEAGGKAIGDFEFFYRPVRGCGADVGDREDHFTFSTRSKVGRTGVDAEVPPRCRCRLCGSGDEESAEAEDDGQARRSVRRSEALNESADRAHRALLLGHGVVGRAVGVSGAHFSPL